ncbi:nucleolar protein 11-like [Hemitrygon akajei]|uniref:nucleolar protein 11-like n=1 Tax=Hemitrygon akajei TaxID=2704970 RepID=UPI003BFA34CD
MARLYEEFTLCWLQSGGSVRAVEPAGPDCVLVTREDRTVVVYKVSDQKPLGSWTVKQTQAISCPAIYNKQTGEYVVVHDHKVLRIWKDDDANLEKTFKATLSADIYQIHTLPKAEPLVLFEQGSVRKLDDVLSAPQQELESVLSKDEVIRWSTASVEAGSPVVFFVTEKGGIFQLYTQRLNLDVHHKYELDSGEDIGYPLSFALSLEREGTALLCLYSTGCIYKIQLSLNRNSADKDWILSQSLLWKLTGCVDSLVNAAILALDETHVAVLGAPQSHQCSAKDSLSIWNTRFQTLQAWKELPEGSSGQLWCYDGKLFVPHGKALSVIPFTCETCSLAAVLGKLKQPSEGGTHLSTVVNWNTMLQEQQYAELHPPVTLDTAESTPSRKRKNRKLKKTQTQSSLNQTMIECESNEKIDEKLNPLLSNLLDPNAQQMITQVATILVTRCMVQNKFYPKNALVKLLQTQMLSYSLCPDLITVAMNKADYYLLQLCLKHFPDIPEAVVCACLKFFLNASETDLEEVIVDSHSAASYMEVDQSSSKPEENMEIVENGFNSILTEDDSSNVPTREGNSNVPAEEYVKDSWKSATDSVCPVGLKKAALLNEILLSSYSEAFLLPPLKDLTVAEVILFLEYLQYLYMKQCQTFDTILPGERIPTTAQVLDWLNLLLDAHFTLLVMTSEAHKLLKNFNSFITYQVRFYSELNKIEESLQQLQKVKPQNDGLYSIEVIKIC